MGRKMIDLTGQNINGIIIKGVVDEEGKAGKHKRWYCLCPICNKTFITSSQHLRDKHKPISMCFDCSIRQYKDLTGMIFGRLTVLSKDNDISNNRVKFICQCKCGSIVSVQSNHLITGKVLSCGCMISSGEDRIGEYLSSKNIVFEKQKKFPGCKSKKDLRFDFYIPSINAVIEYQGIQHYVPIKYFGGDEAFEDRKKKDQIKVDYCMKNNIKYYSISYKENLEEKLEYILSCEEIVCPYGNIAG